MEVETQKMTVKFRQTFTIEHEGQSHLVGMLEDTLSVEGDLETWLARLQREFAESWKAMSQSEEFAAVLKKEMERVRRTRMCRWDIMWECTLCGRCRAVPKYAPKTCIE
jgi:hypothetical protein